MQGRAPKAGGNADVEAAILASAKSSSSSESSDEEYVAVKKLRFDEDTNDDHTLAVSRLACSVHSRKGILTRQHLALSRSLTKLVF